MGIFKVAAFISVLATAVQIALFVFKRRVPNSLGGYVDKGYDGVDTAFRKNFENGWESEGACFAVYHKGKLVVDLWGGYADMEARRTWKKDSVSLVFSSGKAVVSVVLAMLMDRKNLSPQDLVGKYWPEFAKNGKEKTTVSMLVNHLGGLPFLDTDFTPDMLRNRKAMAQAFESQKPHWIPGTKRGYHPYTFGWLADQLVERADPQGRNLSQFFYQEIAEPNGIDYYIGLPLSEWHRVARVKTPSLYQYVQQLTNVPFWKWYMTFLAQSFVNPMLRNAIEFPSFLKMDAGLNPHNSPEMATLEIPAANSIGNARSLAKILSLFGNQKIVSKKTLEKLKQPEWTKQDIVTNMNISSSLGLVLSVSPKGTLQLGHPGYGGQNVMYDPEHDMAFAYVTNSLGPDLGPFCQRFNSLQNALYKSIK